MWQNRNANQVLLPQQVLPTNLVYRVRPDYNYIDFHREYGSKMDQGPLVIEQIDAGTRFLTDFEKHVPVQAAFWIRESDDGPWSLYVASDEIDDAKIATAYEEVLRIASRLRDPNFDPFQVKLVGVDDPLSRAAIDILQRYPGRLATRLGRRNFGGISIEEGYVYPLPIIAS